MQPGAEQSWARGDPLLLMRWWEERSLQTGSTLPFFLTCSLPPQPPSRLLQGGPLPHPHPVPQGASLPEFAVPLVQLRVLP